MNYSSNCSTEFSPRTHKLKEFSNQPIHPRVIILSDQYPWLLFATMEPRLWSGHSAATVYTVSKMTSGKRYWSVKI